MGNLHSNRETEVINPAGSPYLHIIPASYFGEKIGSGYRYTPSLEGIRIRFGCIRGLDFNSFQLKDLLEVSLLPPLETVPPPEYVAATLVQQALETHSSDLKAAIGTGVNALYCSHGSLWGFLPEKRLKQLLEDQGLEVLSAFPRVGGRKRIQEHAVVIIY